jgi:hypothetical protein
MRSAHVLSFELWRGVRVVPGGWLTFGGGLDPFLMGALVLATSCTVTRLPSQDEGIYSRKALWAENVTALF